MKLRAKLMMFTAAAALSANMAFAAIDPQALAADYIAEGYSFVEVKQGPTQTKIEAIMGDVKVEVIYDNATGGIIKQETETADDEDIGRTGIQIKMTDDDFEDDDEDDDDEDDEDEDDDDNSGHDDDDDSGHDDDDDEDDDDEDEDDDDDEDDSDDDSDSDGDSDDD